MRFFFYGFQTNTFQAVLITDGTYTFLKYHYPCNSLQWASPKF